MVEGSTRPVLAGSSVGTASVVDYPGWVFGPRGCMVPFACMLLTACPFPNGDFDAATTRGSSGTTQEKDPSEATDETASTSNSSSTQETITSSVTEGSTATVDPTDSVTTEATESTVDPTESTVTTGPTDATSSTDGTDSSTDPTESESDTMVMEACPFIEPMAGLTVIKIETDDLFVEPCGTDVQMFARVNWENSSLRFNYCIDMFNCDVEPFAAVEVDHPLPDPPLQLNLSTLPHESYIELFFHYGSPTGGNDCSVSGLGIASSSKMEFMMFTSRVTNPQPDMLIGEFEYHDLALEDCMCQSNCCDMQDFTVGGYNVILDGPSLNDTVVLLPGFPASQATWHGDPMTRAANVHAFFPDECDAKPNFAWMISRLPLDQ